MTEILDLTPTEKSDEALLNEMLTEIQTLNKVAVLKEDDNVIRAILRGKSRASILRELQAKYPNDNFVKKDLDDFLLLYREILVHEKTDVEKSYVRQLIKSQTGLTNQLIDLAVKAKDMATRYDDEKDNANAVGAIRTAADIFMKFAKVQGLVREQPEINVNMQMDRMVSEISTGESDFKKSVLKIIVGEDEEPIDITPKVIDIDATGSE